MGRLGQRGVHWFVVGYQSFHAEYAGNCDNVANATAAATFGFVSAISTGVAAAATAVATNGGAACNGFINGDESNGTVRPSRFRTANSKPPAAERD